MVQKYNSRTQVNFLKQLVNQTQFINIHPSHQSITNPMKPGKIRPQRSAFRDEPSNVKLQTVVQIFDPQHNQHPVETDIFRYLQVKYKINQIPINEEEQLHTIFVSTPNKEKRNVCIFLGHGFGGSSLMYFPIIKLLLEYGNVIMWEIRGMGLSKKLSKYHVELQDCQNFFVRPIQLMLKYYQKYTEIFLISHSFGGYLTLLYTLKYNTFVNKVKEVILLSPVGITPKQQDYKSQMKSFSDCMHVIGNKISWGFHITYKSPFRCICACFKHRVLGDAVKNCGFTKEQQALMRDLLVAMVQLKDGSEGVFFKYFEPRVLPKFPIKPIFTQEPSVKLTIFYGGEQDWVDKKGVEYLIGKFPSKISMKIVKECGHNFPFSPQSLKKVIEEVFSPYRVKKEDTRNSTQQNEPSLNKADSSDESLKKLAETIEIT